MRVTLCFIAENLTPCRPNKPVEVRGDTINLNGQHAPPPTVDIRLAIEFSYTCDALTIYARRNERFVTKLFSRVLQILGKVCLYSNDS